MQFVPRIGEKNGQVIDFKDSEIPFIASIYTFIAGCAVQAADRRPAAAVPEAASAAVAACKSALALKSGANAVFVLPMSHAPIPGGYEVFLSLKGAQWLCMTDSRANVNRLESR
ncbi:hypothetical protein [Acidovorax bellezanensis]|nr:hypothetical protein [Acidovorax sp. Be4]